MGIIYVTNTTQVNIHMDNDMSCFFILFYSISSNPSMRFNTKHNITHDDREYRYIMEKKSRVKSKYKSFSCTCTVRGLLTRRYKIVTISIIKIILNDDVYGKMMNNNVSF